MLKKWTFVMRLLRLNLIRAPHRQVLQMVARLHLEIFGDLLEQGWILNRVRIKTLKLGAYICDHRAPWLVIWYLPLAFLLNLICSRPIDFTLFQCLLKMRSRVSFGWFDRIAVEVEEEGVARLSVLISLHLYVVQWLDRSAVFAIRGNHQLICFNICSWN